MKSNKAISYTLIFFFIVFLGDLISTLAVGELVQYLEANPLYKHIGLVGISLLNVLYICLFWWLYKRADNPNKRFIWLNILITVCIVRVQVVYSNIRIAMDPPTLEQAMAVTTAIKTAAMMKIYALTIVPLFIGVITYYVWRLDHDVKIKKIPKIKWDSVKFLQGWNDNVNKMRSDILLKASNSTFTDDDAPFWQRNKTQLYTLLLFGGMTGFFYLIGWPTLFRISGLILIIFVITNIIAMIKGLFKGK